MVERPCKRMMEEEAATTISAIPEDIVHNIFSNLPMKSLLRSKSVSKHWSRLISQHITRTQKVLLSRSVNFLFRSIDQTTHVEDIDIVGDRPYPCGSCNGQLLFRVGRRFFLWNPSIHSVEPVLKLSNTCIGEVLGLCFDSYNRDYKIVMQFCHEILVGSTKTKDWKEVDLPCHGGALVRPGVVLHNNLHWWYEEGSFLQRGEVVRFDPRVDKFTILPIPQRHRGEKPLGLGALDGCLCMCRWEKPFCSYIGGSIEVLVMKKYGVKESWAVLFKFIPNRHDINSLVPLFYTDDVNRPRVVMQVGRICNTAIVAYDIDSCFCEDIHILGDNNDVKSTIVYEEISITHPNCLNKTQNTSKAHTVQKKVWQLMRKPID